MPDTTDTWTLGARSFRSRIIVGTGKYASNDQTRDALAASGAEIVTVALRRVDLSAKQTVLDAIDRSRYVLLPNTAGCYTADEAVRTLHLARELGMDDFVKLEVIGDPKTLFPDNAAPVEAAGRAHAAAPRQGGGGGGAAPAGQGGLPGAALLRRRPGDLQAARGRRL